jgi:hypothetical protein
MFKEMVTWLGGQQVMDPADPQYRSIYFRTEDRYCNRDTACAAAAFLRQFQVTGDGEWRRKASLARDYVIDVHQENGGYPEMRGRQKSDGGSAVNTSIVADRLIRAFELGLDCGPQGLDALARMARFVMTLEWQPGAFYHDTNHVGEFHDHRTGERLWGPEGSKLDCQNTTALSAMMLLRIAHFLQARGQRPDPAWSEAAARAVRHLLEGQEPNGHWPYYKGASWQDTGHHAMCLYYLAVVAQFPPYDQDPGVREALARAGRWLVDGGLLQTKRGTKIDWATTQSACTYFTNEYFLVSAPLARLGNFDSGRRDFWHHEALEVMRYVRTALWDNPARDAEGPFRLTEAGIRIGYAWFGQSMGWAVYQLDDLIDQTGGWE